MELLLKLLIIFQIFWTTTGDFNGTDKELEKDGEILNIENFRLRKRDLNDRPIIGILAQEYWGPRTYTDNSIQNRASHKKAYIPAAHVKFLEGGGGRVVPILTDNRDENYWRRMFNSINGIFFPGGIVNLRRSDYAAAAKFLYKLAMEANDKGTYFPIWGECLGLQFLLFEEAGKPRSFRSKCDYQNRTVPVNFVVDPKKSRLYGEMSRTLLKTISTTQQTAHNHKLCVTTKNFEKYHLDDVYRILTTNFDERSQSTFVSSIEGNVYPFYGLAFHPELSTYEFSSKRNIPHSSKDIEIAQYFARFFVDETRKNSHHFATEQEEEENLIYNFETIYSGIEYYKNLFYFFPRS